MQKQPTRRLDRDPFRHDRRNRRNARHARYEPEHRHTIHMISTRSLGLMVDREPEDRAD